MNIVDFIFGAGGIALRLLFEGGVSAVIMVATPFVNQGVRAWVGNSLTRQAKSLIRRGADPKRLSDELAAAEAVNSEILDNIVAVPLLGGVLITTDLTQLCFMLGYVGWKFMTINHRKTGWWEKGLSFFDALMNDVAMCCSVGTGILFFTSVFNGVDFVSLAVKFFVENKIGEPQQFARNMTALATGTKGSLLAILVTCFGYTLVWKFLRTVKQTDGWAFVFPALVCYLLATGLVFGMTTPFFVTTLICGMLYVGVWYKYTDRAFWRERESLWAVIFESHTLFSIVFQIVLVFFQYLSGASFQQFLQILLKQLSATPPEVVPTVTPVVPTILPTIVPTVTSMIHFISVVWIW